MRADDSRLGEPAPGEPGIDAAATAAPAGGSGAQDALDGCYLDFGVSGYGVAIKLHHDRDVDPADIGDLLRETMDEIARECVEMGSRFIGHIKSHLVCAQGNLKADTIGIKHPAALHGQLSGPAKDLYVAINSIVQGISEEQVKQATLHGAHLLAERHGFRVVKEREHLYFDEYDFQKDDDYLESLREQFDAGDELTAPGASESDAVGPGGSAPGPATSGRDEEPGT